MYEAYHIDKELTVIDNKIYDAREKIMEEIEDVEAALENYIENNYGKLADRAENALEKVREAMELLLDATNDIEGENDEEE